MYMKLQKKILIFLGICLSVYLIYIMVLLASVFGRQRMPTVKVPEELIQLKKEIENDRIKITFYNISEIALEECNAKQRVTLRVAEDSITKSKETLDNYINSINKAVNERLINKKCIDSLVIIVSSYYRKEKIDSLKSKRYTYSFPINEK